METMWWNLRLHWEILSRTEYIFTIDKTEFDEYKGIDNGGNLIQIVNSEYYLDTYFVEQIRRFEPELEIQQRSLEDILFKEMFQHKRLMVEL